MRKRSKDFLTYGFARCWSVVNQAKVNSVAVGILICFFSQEENFITKVNGIILLDESFHRQAKSPKRRAKLFAFYFPFFVSRRNFPQRRSHSSEAFRQLLLKFISSDNNSPREKFIQFSPTSIYLVTERRTTKCFFSIIYFSEEV